MLTMTGFAFANFISYFVRSSTPFVTVLGRPAGVPVWHEMVGVPFVLFDYSWGYIIPILHVRWINLIANFAVAFTASYVAAVSLADRLPPLWPGQSRSFRFSLLALFFIITLAGVLIAIATLSQSWGLLVRNVVCLAGPIGVYSWSMYRRRTSWVLLVVAAVGLSMLTSAVDLRYEERLFFIQPDWRTVFLDWEKYSNGAFTRSIIGVTLIRASVTVFGVLSVLLISTYTYTLLRQHFRDIVKC